MDRLDLEPGAALEEIRVLTADGRGSVVRMAWFFSPAKSGGPGPLRRLRNRQP